MCRLVWNLGIRCRVHKSTLVVSSLCHITPVHIFMPSFKNYFNVGHTVAKLAEALRYKAEGRGFDFRCGHWDFSLT